MKKKCTAVIGSQLIRSLLSGGEICDTIILSFNGEILEQVKQMDGVYEGGYLTNLKWPSAPWYIYEVDGFKLAVAMAYWLGLQWLWVS